MWLALPCHFEANLEPILTELGMKVSVFGRLSSWFLRQEIRTPADLVNHMYEASARSNHMQVAEQATAYATHGAEGQQERTEALLQTAGLLPRRVVVDSLTVRRGVAPPAESSSGETCVVCWEGQADEEGGALMEWQECGRLLHGSCYRRWFW